MDFVELGAFLEGPVASTRWKLEYAPFVLLGCHPAAERAKEVASTTEFADLAAALSRAFQNREIAGNQPRPSVTPRAAKLLRDPPRARRSAQPIPRVVARSCVDWVRRNTRVEVAEVVVEWRDAGHPGSELSKAKRKRDHQKRELRGLRAALAVVMAEPDACKSREGWSAEKIGDLVRRRRSDLPGRPDLSADRVEKHVREAVKWAKAEVARSAETESGR